ncbi:MAG: DUF411 domain-containing protein [Oleiphilus sp.]
MKLLFQFFVMLVVTPLVFADDLLSKDITVYKNPECGCCFKWVDYLKGYDYNVNVIDTRDVLSIKAKHKIPEQLAACHTAMIDGYIIEGHVTERDIRRLLLFRPKVKGIAVPGMPFGTPGMERGDTIESYNVMSFDEEGNIEVFVEH